jgi:hypothetical protein
MRGLLRIPSLPTASSDEAAAFVSSFAQSLTETACRERYKVLTLAITSPPVAALAAGAPLTAPLLPTPSPVLRAGAASHNAGGSEGAVQDASSNLDAKSAALARLYAINARKQAASASAAAARVVQSAGGAAGGSAVARDFVAAADVVGAESAPPAPVKPISALLQGDFVLDSFTEYVKAPVLPELSREGLWSSRVRDGDDDDDDEEEEGGEGGFAAGPLGRAALLAKISGAAQTDLEGLE